MTDDSIVDMEDLDAFSNTLFNENEGEEASENEDNSLATDDEPEDEGGESSDDSTDESDSNDHDDEDEDEDEEEEEKEEKPRKNRKSFQNRIDEVIRSQRQTERELAAARRELEELKTRKTEVVDEPKVPALRDALPEGAPNPDAVDADGERLYPLGEFDPTYLRDITRFTFNAEAAAKKEREAQEEQQKRLNEERATLKQSWDVKLAEAAEEEPEILEDLQDFAAHFENLDPGYAEYLANTLMSCENGPQIMHYLSQHIGEAQRIVASGAFAATLEIGKLDAKLSRANKGETQSNKKVSKAPEPPKAPTKGRRQAVEVSGDTDNLSAFERAFYQKK